MSDQYAPTEAQLAAREKWIVALEQERYPQTKGELFRANPELDMDGLEKEPAGYCCLGVAAQVFSDEFNVPLEVVCLLRGWRGDSGGDPWRTTYATSELPSPVKHWLGFENTNFMDQLATDNDNGRTFPQIAEQLRRAESLRWYVEPELADGEERDW